MKIIRSSTALYVHVIRVSFFFFFDWNIRAHNYLAICRYYIYQGNEVFLRELSKKDTKWDARHRDLYNTVLTNRIRKERVVTANYVCTRESHKTSLFFENVYILYFDRVSTFNFLLIFSIIAVHSVYMNIKKNTYIIFPDFEAILER